MIRDSERLTKTSQVLLYLLAVKEAARDIARHRTLRDAVAPEYDAYFQEKKLERTVRRLQQQGWISTEYVETKAILRLTKAGKIEALLRHLQTISTQQKWDGKWRLIMFDIPEGARSVRHHMRQTLKAFGYVCLQASIYAHPYPLSSAAIELLKESGLTRYIRIARAEFEDDADLRKHFHIRTGL
ncbi:MAG: CRISPR-associated endonuclease Cas2 [Candidatus Doudnabacteria bacterium]|nr:CRISPR-associated endonuclease Cas2 [Candidatus Doudnabacteria bacterium]